MGLTSPYRKQVTRGFDNVAESGIVDRVSQLSRVHSAQETARRPHIDM